MAARFIWCFSISWALLDAPAQYALWQGLKNTEADCSVGSIPCHCPFAPIEHCVLPWNSNEATLTRGDMTSKAMVRETTLTSSLSLSSTNCPLLLGGLMPTHLHSFSGSSLPYWFILREAAPIKKRQTSQHCFHIGKCYFSCQGICLENKPNSKKQYFHFRPSYLMLFCCFS